MRQLVSMFDQEAIEADQAVASLLSLLSSLSPHPPLPDCQTIIEKLQTSSYCSLSVLLRLEEERRPSLTPIPVDQITEETVYERVNLLSQCSSLPPLSPCALVFPIIPCMYAVCMHSIPSLLQSIRPA